jgi:hypothetical protein
MELYLHLNAGLACNCEREDTLSKLRRLGLVEATEEGRCRALPPERAIAALRTLWNSYQSGQREGRSLRW